MPRGIKAKSYTVVYVFMVFRRVKELLGIGSTPQSESKAYYSSSTVYREGVLPPISGRNDGYGYCLRCEGSWADKQPHWTWYSSQAMGPLCEECYDSLTPEERWPYYLKLWEIWGSPADVDLGIIKRAIGLEAAE